MAPCKTHRNGHWWCADLAQIEYADAWALQSGLVQAKHDGTIKENILLFVEHPPVFTLGKRGGKENLKVTESFLRRAGIQMVQVERGGNITFHGPGQLVMYPIVKLRSVKLSVVEYVERLEEVMIRTLADWEIDALRRDENRGVWVRNSKIGSVGIAVRRGVSFHGGSLNVNVSLNPFRWIDPCGLKNIGITSMENERSEKISMNQVHSRVKKHFTKVFNADMRPITIEQLRTLLDANHDAPLPAAVR